MSNTITLDFLKENNLVLVNKDALLDFMVDANLKTKADKRVLWIDRKTAQKKYNLNRYWFLSTEADENNVLQINSGKGKTSTKKYNEQSIINELKRQSI